jgi:predicted DsbA family dithiol-disulfide isomerase
MAMTSLAPTVAPVITKTKKLVAEKSTRAALRLVADATEGKQANRRFFALFMTTIGIAGLFILLVINTLLAQDAFTLAKLQADVKLSSDQYEAVTEEIERISSPAVLANKATKLGMRPSITPTFLDINTPIEPSGVASHG